jgi:serine-type D-Ala-D-Ala carboxypeptidase
VNSAITRTDHLLSPRPADLNPPDSISAALGQQDSRFAAAFEIIERAIAARAFPAASVAVTSKTELLALRAFGRFTFDPASPPVTPATLFDIASLSKVVATTAMAMILYERGLLDLDAPVAGIIPEFVSTSPATREDDRRRTVSVRMLLSHTSGLAAHQKFYLTARTREGLLNAVYSAPLKHDPGDRAEYSDLGFILLAVLLECIAGEPLDVFCQREIFGPLAMTSTTFNPPPELRPQIPPTANECGGLRNPIIQGEVQDENASVLGGVAGHAGLFSTAEDLSRFARALLQGAWPILRPETVALFTRREGTSSGSHALGWDTPSAQSQAGKYFGPHSFGHLGYTGTSLWIDPERQLSITLLTNRTWPDSANQAIKQIRPKLHDAVVESLGLNKD